MKHSRKFARQKGFTYVIAMFLVAVLSVASMAALERAITNDRRDKEAQLLYVGLAYRAAIMNYYVANKAYPTDVGCFANTAAQCLKILLEDTNTSTLTRYLRRPYFDPMTGGDFQIVTEGSNIIGVASTSTQRPIKTGAFPLSLVSAQQAAQQLNHPCDLLATHNFLCAQTYQEWKFIYTPPQ